MENLYTPHAVRTVTGQYVDFINPNPGTFNLEDIAHSLSQKPRFNGQLKSFYSVAQHCCLICDYLPTHLKADGLMHDAPEAYMADVPSPLKSLLPDYKDYEERIHFRMTEKWDIQYPIPKEVKEMDRFFLEKEWYGLMLRTAVFGHEMWSPEQAKQEFIYRFNKYVKPRP